MHVRIREGLDLPLGQAPGPEIRAAPALRTVAVLPGDHRGLRPRACVAVGEHLRLGQPVVVDRRRPELCLTAPGPGVVEELRIGARRRLGAVVIALDDASGAEADGEELFPARSGSGAERFERAEVEALLLRSGCWFALRTRPFGLVPEPGSEPEAIAVTVMDTNPLAADPRLAIAGREEDFVAGLRALTTLTRGRVFVCHAPGPELPLPESERVVAACFEGPHPAGLPGTHLHRLLPVGPRLGAWHLGAQDLLAIGRLLRTGRLDAERVISIAGPLVREPRLVRAPLGASVLELVAGALLRTESLRLISGSALFGREARGDAAWLGRHHLQVTALPDEGEAAPSGRPFTAARFPFRRGAGAFSTASHGRATGLFPSELFEDVFPFDIPAVPLLRALAAGNLEAALELGCLELDEEDLALLSFVCPAKLDHGAQLRLVLARAEKEQRLA